MLTQYQLVFNLIFNNLVYGKLFDKRSLPVKLDMILKYLVTKLQI